MTTRAVLSELQQAVAVFMADHQLEAAVETRHLDLVSEVGGLALEKYRQCLILKGEAGSRI